MAGVCVLAWLAVLSLFDIRVRRLPNWLTIPGAVVGAPGGGVHDRAG